jgi:hypothetical protein
MSFSPFAHANSVAMGRGQRPRRSGQQRRVLLGVVPARSLSNNALPRRKVDRRRPSCTPLSPLPATPQAHLKSLCGRNAMQMTSARKGYCHTRWQLNGRTVDLVNVHLFHDASNLEALTTVRGGKQRGNSFLFSLLPVTEATDVCGNPLCFLPTLLSLFSDRHPPPTRSHVIRPSATSLTPFSQTLTTPRRRLLFLGT